MNEYKIDNDIPLPPRKPRSKRWYTADAELLAELEAGLKSEPQKGAYAVMSEVLLRRNRNVNKKSREFVNTQRRVINHYNAKQLPK